MTSGKWGEILVENGPCSSYSISSYRGGSTVNLSTDVTYGSGQRRAILHGRDE